MVAIHRDSGCWPNPTPYPHRYFEGVPDINPTQSMASIIPGEPLPCWRVRRGGVRALGRSRSPHQERYPGSSMVDFVKPCCRWLGALGGCAEIRLPLSSAFQALMLRERLLRYVNAAALRTLRPERAVRSPKGGEWMSDLGYWRGVGFLKLRRGLVRAKDTYLFLLKRYLDSSTSDQHREEGWQAAWKRWAMCSTKDS